MKVTGQHNQQLFSTSNYQNRSKPSFGIANSGKLKNLFTYGLPCMYTGVEMIDPRRVQRLINTNAFDAPVNEVVQSIKPFEKSITGIEFEVLKIIKTAAQKYPDVNLQQLLNILVPKYRAKLKSKQFPILESINQLSQKLPDEIKYKFVHLMAETEDKINGKPVFLPFSSYEFKYKLDKIREDISQNGSPKEIRVMNKLILESSKLPDETNEGTQDTQQEILKFLNIILKSSALKKNTQLKKLIKDSQKRLNNESFIIPFSRKVFIYDVNNLLDTAENQELAEEIRQLASKLPSSSNNASAYILKFSREPSWKTGYRLLWPNMASIEHIKPQSKGGKDELENFGGAGTRANAQRGNIDFTEQIKLVPETAQNSQKYIDSLTGLAKRGIFIKEKVNTSYIDGFAKTVYEESNNRLRLDTSEIQKHRLKGNALMNILYSILNNK